ncbi:MAG: hypothetical protein CM1200mP30_25500 [Pseudomonadota bacterium]|nr:MAG: hypothetical protein CM1200mP30_25500 [Pseudomonadota bacterium]
MYYDVAEYTAHFGAVKIDFTPYQYFTGIAAGLVLAGIACLGLAVVFGWIVFGPLWTLFCDRHIGSSHCRGRTCRCLGLRRWWRRKFYYQITRAVQKIGKCFFIFSVLFPRFLLLFFSSGFIQQDSSWPQCHP